MPKINSTRQPSSIHGGYDNDASQQLEDAAKTTDQTFERGSINERQRDSLHEMLQETRHALASTLSRRAQPYVAWGALAQPGITLTWQGPVSYLRISRNTECEAWDVTWQKARTSNRSGKARDRETWTTDHPFADPKVMRAIRLCTDHYSSDRWNIKELVKRQGECLLRINADESGSPANWRIEIAETGRIVQSGTAKDARDAMRDAQLSYEEMNRNIKRRRRGELDVGMPLDARGIARRNERMAAQGMPKNERHGQPREKATPE